MSSDNYQDFYNINKRFTNNFPPSTDGSSSISAWDIAKQSTQKTFKPPVVNEEKESIYRILSNYFGDIHLVKGFDSQPDGLGKSYSFYYAKPGCLMCIEDHYLVVITENDNFPAGNIEKLSNLEWISFQTRTFETPPIKNLKIQSFNAIEDNSHTFLYDIVKLVKKIGNKWIYEPNISPVKVELLDPEETEVYSEKGTIKTCLDTFNCIITFVI